MKSSFYILTFLFYLSFTSIWAVTYECPVATKFSEEYTYSKEHLNKYTPSVRVVDNGDNGILSRCSYESSAKKVTCDDYPIDYIVSDSFVGHKKYYVFRSQFDMQIFSGLGFVENNGRGTISFGKCRVTRP